VLDIFQYYTKKVFCPTQTVLDGLALLPHDHGMNTRFAPITPTASIAPVVERVETLLIDLPTIRPHKLSVATIDGQTLMLVKVHCSDGIVGIGERTTIGGLAYGAESPEGMKLAVDTYFASIMIG
jgi:muconate cycloisomerase